MDKTFIFSWDMTGIESIIPVDDYDKYEQEATWAVLNDEVPGRNPLIGTVQHLILRARANPQRHYEIYSVSCEEDMSVEDWRELWESTPQEMANLIRERGQKMYSDRASKRTQVIE
jgi:hypothetical protein